MSSVLCLDDRWMKITRVKNWPVEIQRLPFWVLSLGLRTYAREAKTTSPVFSNTNSIDTNVCWTPIIVIDYQQLAFAVAENSLPPLHAPWTCLLPFFTWLFCRLFSPFLFLFYPCFLSRLYTFHASRNKEKFPNIS